MNNVCYHVRFSWPSKLKLHEMIYTTNLVKRHGDLYFGVSIEYVGIPQHGPFSLYTKLEP